MPDTVYDAGPQGLNRYSYALNNPLRYLDPTGRLAYAAQYALATSYDMLPYIDQVDTGNNLADQALAVGAGVYNLGAMLVNALPNVYGVTEDAYNAGTEAVIGQKGLSGQGLTEDLLVLEASGMPLGTIIEQAKQSGAYLKTYIQANAPKLAQWGKAALASETGSVYLGGGGSKKTEVIVRRTNAAEAAQMTDAKGLVPKPGSRGAKWVSQGKAQKSLSPKGHEKTVIMEVESGTIQWLSNQAVDLMDVGGEARLPKGVLTKSYEQGAFGIGIDLIKEFNRRVKRVIVK